MFMIKRGLQAVGLGLALFSLSGSAVNAQYFAMRPGASYYFNQNLSPAARGFGFNYGYNFGFRINHVNPVTGQRFVYKWNEGGFNVPPGFIPTSFFSPNYYNGYMSGGYGAPYNGYQNAYNYGSGSTGHTYTPYTNSREGTTVNSQWGYEMQNKRKPAKISLEVSQLLDPTTDQLLSGQAINDLIALVNQMTSKGATADSALLPPGLVDQIEFQGGPAASVLALLKGGKSVFPASLLTPENLPIKQDLEAALAPLSEAMTNGRAPGFADANRMSQAVGSAKKKLTNDVRNLALEDGLELTRFLNSLEGVSRAAKDSKLSGVYVAKWKAVGPTVSELIEHMKKYQLEVAPAMASHEDAYATFHRGLVSYYLSLSQNKN